MVQSVLVGWRVGRRAEKSVLLVLFRDFAAVDRQEVKKNIHDF